MLDLTCLVGTWQGHGSGQFPNIDPFQYREEWVVSSNNDPNLVHFVQRTFLTPDETPSHWESGFIRLLDSGKTEWTFTDNGDRIGLMQETDFTSTSPQQWTRLWTLAEPVNDPRILDLNRQINDAGDSLIYTFAMATTTVDDHKIHPHLSARLQRQ